MPDELREKSKLRLGPSSIHGVGVFATRDISQGESVYADDFPKLYHVSLEEVPKEIAERHPYVATKGRLAYPDVRFQAYMNHSHNANYDAHQDIALQNIQEGEEVTEDYRLIDGWEKVYPWLMV